MTKYIIKMILFCSLPTILQLGAHTSIVSFLQAFKTQWYSNEEQECVMFLQLFFSAATFHSLAVFGHECTFLAVAPDSSHSLSAPAFTNIWYWTLDSNYFMKTCIQVMYIIIICQYVLCIWKHSLVRFNTLFINCYMITKWRRKSETTYLCWWNQC